MPIYTREPWSPWPTGALLTSRTQNAETRLGRVSQLNRAGFAQAGTTTNVPGFEARRRRHAKSQPTSTKYIPGSPVDPRQSMLPPGQSPVTRRAMSFEEIVEQAWPTFIPLNLLVKLKVHSHTHQISGLIGVSFFRIFGCSLHKINL